MLRCLEAKENEEIREFLRESGYAMEELRRHFGNVEIPQFHLLKLYQLGVPFESSRVGVLLQWFWIGVAVKESTAREVIPERMMELFLKSGLLSDGDGSLTSPVHIAPFAEFLVVSDPVLPKSGQHDKNTVLWPNPTTLMAHRFSMRTPAGRTLDLGTGSGALALAAAAHSGSVVATDLNPRAREFCQFNAALNGVSNIEFREGNAFEPVRGERFDLMVINPPFFVTPSVRQIFSDNVMELDGFCRMLVREAPEYLNENGYCQILAEWVEIDGQPWRERLKEWVEDLGCDVMVLAGYARTVGDYTMIRVQESPEENHNAAVQATVIREWLEYFAHQRVKAIYGGMVVLRKRKGRNWIRMDEVYAQPVGPFGEFVQGCFNNQDALKKHSDEGLPETRPFLPPGSRLRQQFAMTPQGWQLASVELLVGEGLPLSSAIQPQVAELVGLCDGKRTIREIADQIAARAQVDPGRVLGECCTIIRKLAERGMVRL